MCLRRPGRISTASHSRSAAAARPPWSQRSTTSQIRGARKMRRTGCFTSTTSLPTGIAAAVYGSFLIAPLLGRALREKPSAIKIIVAATLPAAFFYLATNFVQWIVDGGHVHAMYSRDWSGLVACYSAGIPFFRWMLEGDLLFAALLFGAYALATVWQRPRRMIRQPVVEDRLRRR